jgi:diguanylate cyclase (GGDEF)-like protein
MRIRRRYCLQAVGSAVAAFLLLLSFRNGPQNIATELVADLVPNLAFLFLTCAFYGLAARHLEREAEHLEAASSTDPHTGLANFRVFEQRLDAEESLATRHGTSLAVLVIDVDRLKTLNDTDGHRAGDRALRLVARCLRRGARAEDVIARWGGDEFVILCPATGRADALALANRILRSVDDLSESRVTVSIGVAATERVGWIPPASLFDEADRALYEAKKAGRNQTALAGCEARDFKVTRLPSRWARRRQSAVAPAETLVDEGDAR